MHVVGPGYLSHRLSGIATGQCLTLLVRGELRLSSEPYPSRLRAVTTLAGARPDQLSLKLGQAAEHSQHQSAVRGRGIRPGVVEGPEASLLIGNGRQGVQQVASLAGEPIKAGHENPVSWGKRAQEARKLRTVCPCAAHLLPEDLLGSRCLELSDLGIKGLTVGRDPRIPVNSHETTFSSHV
jgi:hypothetical protein